MAEGSPTGSDSPVDAAESAASADGGTVEDAATDGGAPEAAAETPAEAVGGEAPTDGYGDAILDRLDDLRDDDGEIRVSRREALAYGAGTGAGLGSWKALHNVVLGYGIVAGTNVLEQDLDALAGEHFGVRGSVAGVAGGYEIRADADSAGLYDGEERIAGVGIDSDPAAAERIDAEYGLAGSPFAELHADVNALAAGEVTFAFSKTEEFLARVEAGDPRPYTVDALRGPVFDSPEAEFVAEFADAHPSDAAALIEGIKDGFREYSSYDIPRYVAGSIQDNVILGAHDLRQYFESPTSFEALANGENTGLFCTELVNRSIEAFHAVPAVEQSPPVVAGSVYDERHKHSYTVLASAIREDGELVFPATFVDYTHSTLYDDLYLTWLLGEGLEAYNSRHRVTEIFWNRYTSI